MDYLSLNSAVTSFTVIVATMLIFLGSVKIFDDVFGAGPSAKKFGIAFKEFNATPTFSKAYIGATIMSDWVYGEKLFSRRALFVSIFVTLAWLIILFLISLCLYGKHSWFFNRVFSGFVAKNFWYLLFIGMAIDFISTCVTRKLLFYAIDKSALIKICTLTIDVIVSIILFYVLFSLAKISIIGLHFLSLSDSLVAWLDGIFNLQSAFKFLHNPSFIPHGSFLEMVNGDSEVIYAFPEGMIFLSSLLTSFWIAIHIIAHYMYRLTKKNSIFFSWLVSESAIETKPILSVAFILCLYSLFPLWIFVMAYQFLSSLH